MFSRLFVSVIFTLFSGTSTLACSCGPWEGGLTSEFVSDYTSFWGVPIQSELAPRSPDRPGSVVTYKIEILEDFERIGLRTTEVISSVADGGSCGIQLTMGIPQFLSAYEGKEGQLGINSCTPHLPYKAIKNYLEKGIDTYIPGTNECFGEDLELNSENSDCLVWEGASLDPWTRIGNEDWLFYMKKWREREEEKLSEP